MDSFPPYKQIDHPAMPKSKLNSLLLILIATLFASGLALIILKQIETYHREQLYLATQATLPEHGSGKKQAVASCLALPEDVSENQNFKTWLSKKKIDGVFCGEEITQIKPDTQRELLPNAELECRQDVQTLSGGYFLPSPDKKRSVCMGNFGEPNSNVWLNDKITNLQSRLKFCGTPCSYEAGFWLDNDRFVLLETDSIDGVNSESLVQVFDIKENTQQIWRENKNFAAYGTVSEIANWKTYRNEQYGFELTFTEPLKKYRSGAVYGNKYSNIPFSIPDTRGYIDIFAILIYEKSEWKKLENSDSLPIHSYITEDENNVFVYQLSHDPPQGIPDLANEVKRVISTFKFIK